MLRERGGWNRATPDYHADDMGRRPVTMLDIFNTMRLWAIKNWRTTIVLYSIAVALALSYTMLRPREYLVSMIVLPIATTFSDPSNLVATSGLSVRTPLQLGQQPPTQLGAFLRLLKSPELARMLAKEPTIVDLVKKEKDAGLISRLFMFRRGNNVTSTEEQDTAAIYKWLLTHITAEQDIDVDTWNIQIHYPSAVGGVTLLNRIRIDVEDILRRSELDQLSREWEYGAVQLRSTADSMERTVLYSILDSVKRSLLVLQSGANVATVVISQPYAPLEPNYPPRLLTLIGSLVPLLILATAALAYLSSHEAGKCNDARHGRTTAE